MEVRFNNPYLERIYKEGRETGKNMYDKYVIRSFVKKVDLLERLSNHTELRRIAGLNFEALKGDRSGLCSIRIDKKYRLEFYLEKNVITLSDIIIIEELSNHYQEEMSVYKIKKRDDTVIPSEVLLHPGEVLGEELEARGISIRSFARALQVTPAYLYELIEGKHNVSAILAIKLQHELDIPDDLWMRLQAGYDLKLARRELKAALV